MEKIRHLLGQIQAKSAQVDGLFTEADKRGDGVNTPDEIAQIKALNKEIEGLNLQVAELKEMQGLREANGRLAESFKVGTPSVPFSGADGRGGSSIKGAFDLAMENPEFKAFIERFASSPAAKGTMINSPKAAVKNLLTGASQLSAGALVYSDRPGIVDQSYQRPLNIRALLTPGTTGSDLIEYVQIVDVVNNAAPVAEAIATGDASGAKPESAMDFKRVTEPVKTVAHWIPATTRVLSDAGQLRSYTDNFLRYGLEEQLENQIINGDGTGENFTGVLNLVGTTAQAFDTDILVTARKARTKVRITGRAIPTAYVMHPLDWEAIDLLKDNEGRYYYGGPSAIGNPTLWGLPVVESESVPQGTAICAEWRLGLLYDREQSAISVSNSHQDFFVRNLVAILGEMRAAMIWLRPKAFVIADLTA